MTSLNVNWCRSLTDTSIVAIARSCPHLNTISVSGLLLTDCGITAIANGCPLLEKLDVSWCRELTDASLIAIAQSCPLLMDLNVSFCHKLTDTGITATAKGCPQLKSLDISWTGPTSSDCIAFAPNGLTSCDGMGPDVQSLTDAGLIVIAQSCPLLTSLNVSFCKELTDAGVIAIARGCPLLTNLRLLQVDTHQHHGHCQELSAVATPRHLLPLDRPQNSRQPY